MDNPITCATCGRAITREPGSIGTGYGIDRDGRKRCYACCGDRDRADMIATGRATLYLQENVAAWPVAVVNWPGTLRFTVSHSLRGRHNIAGHVTTAYFTGPDGKPWSARRYGDNTEIAHCRRLAN